MAVIGLDIGGTKIKGVLFEGKTIIAELIIVTPKNLLEFERNVLKLCDFLSAKGKVSGVGIGIAGLVDAKSGIVRHSPNIKFIKNLNLVKFFQANGFKKVRIDNDANCFARAEMVLGQGKKFIDFLALTLGTGIGGGIIIEKKIYRGQNNNAAEFGHLVVDNGFLEKQFQKARNEQDYKKMGKLLGKNFATLANFFGPQALILGGGVGKKFGSKFLPAAKAEMKKFLFDKKRQPKVIVSKLKSAGALGAALLIS